MANKFHRVSYRPAVCELLPDEDPVQNDLAYTPSQMFEMAQKGMPVSTQSVALDGMFDEGYRELDFEPPLHLMRHADMADLWEKSRDAKMKIKESVKNAKKKEVTNG